MTAPKEALAFCPFCGGVVKPYESCNEDGIYDGYYVADMNRDECSYGSGVYETEAEAIAAHNTLARKVAMSDGLVGFLLDLQAALNDLHAAWDSDRDMRVGKLVLAMLGRNPGYREDTDRVASFLTRAQSLAPSAEGEGCEIESEEQQQQEDE